MSDLVVRAEAFAVAAHGDQRYGGAPYRVHLAAVVAQLRAFGHEDPATLAAGWLHDVLEDTTVGGEALEAAFGAEVRAAVAFCSDEPGPDRATRKSLTYARMRAALDADPAAWTRGVRVKLADRLANVSACAGGGTPADRLMLAKYAKEHPKFRAALYLPGLADPLFVALDAAFEGASEPRGG